MEPIIKVTVDDGRQDPEIHHFHDIVSAKRWCEHDAQQVIQWQHTPVNPYAFWSNGLDVGGEMIYYFLEPVNITVVEDDGLPE